jgi:hypothetical protein
VGDEGTRARTSSCFRICQSPASYSANGTVLGVIWSGAAIEGNSPEQGSICRWLPAVDPLFAVLPTHRSQDAVLTLGQWHAMRIDVNRGKFIAYFGWPRGLFGLRHQRYPRAGWVPRPRRLPLPEYQGDWTERPEPLAGVTGRNDGELLRRSCQEGQPKDLGSPTRQRDQCSRYRDTVPNYLPTFVGVVGLSEAQPLHDRRREAAARE